MAWPYLSESFCPWCEETIRNPKLTRQHDDGNEYRCPECGKTHVRKEGIDDAVFIFFPGDIAALTRERFPSPFGHY